MFVTGCASDSIAPEPRTDLRIPAYLLEDCEHPSVDLRYNEGMAIGIDYYYSALEDCNDDKRTIRDYIEGTQKPRP